MKVVKVVLDGVTTSFRYPHFLVGRHPTLPMPPPSTIYGHICSAMGDFPDPRELRFAYSFRYGGLGQDMEHLHIIYSVGTPKQRSRPYPGLPPGAPINLNVTVGPLHRDIYLFPHLELYVAAAAEDLLRVLHDRFRCPVYPVVLGRSQDLCVYRTVEMIELERSPNAFYASTLLPWEYRARTTSGYITRMPSFITPGSRHEVRWRDYLILPEAARLERQPPAARVISAAEGDEEWVDPMVTDSQGAGRAVVWHAFIDE